MSARMVVGIDLSLEATALAWNDGHLQRHGRPGLTVVTLRNRGAALLALADELRMRIVARGWPALVLIETLPTSRTQVQAERAYLWHELVRQLWAGAPVVDVTPAQIKLYASGKGNAGKGAVIDAVARRFPAFETGGDDNLADAAVLAAMGADLLGLRLAGDVDDRYATGGVSRVPAAHRKALAKIGLPPGVSRGESAAA